MIGVKTNTGAVGALCPASASMVRTLSLGRFQNSATAESGIEIPIRSPIRIVSARSRLVPDRISHSFLRHIHHPGHPGNREQQLGISHSWCGRHSSSCGVTRPFLKKPRSLCRTAPSPCPCEAAVVDIPKNRPQVRVAQNFLQSDQVLGRVVNPSRERVPEGIQAEGRDSTLNHPQNTLVHSDEARICQRACQDRRLSHWPYRPVAKKPTVLEHW